MLTLGKNIMKKLIAILISALGVTLLAWLYQLCVPTEDPKSYQKITLTAQEEIRDEVFLDISNRYRNEFLSIIRSKPIEKKSSVSFLTLLLFMLPLSVTSILLYIWTLKMTRKADPVVVRQ